MVMDDYWANEGEQYLRSPVAQTSEDLARTVSDVLPSTPVQGSQGLALSESMTVSTFQELCGALTGNTGPSPVDKNQRWIRSSSSRGSHL